MVYDVARPAKPPATRKDPAAVIPLCSGAHRTKRLPHQDRVTSGHFALQAPRCCDRRCESAAIMAPELGVRMSAAHRGGMLERLSDLRCRRGLICLARRTRRIMSKEGAWPDTSSSASWTQMQKSPHWGFTAISTSWKTSADYGAYRTRRLGPSRGPPLWIAIVQIHAPLPVCPRRAW